jgi:hypothetical protein
MGALAGRRHRRHPSSIFDGRARTGNPRGPSAGRPVQPSAAHMFFRNLPQLDFLCGEISITTPADPHGKFAWARSSLGAPIPPGPSHALTSTPRQTPPPLSWRFWNNPEVRSGPSPGNHRMAYPISVDRSRFAWTNSARPLRFETSRLGFLAPHWKRKDFRSKKHSPLADGIALSPDALGPRREAAPLRAKRAGKPLWLYARDANDTLDRRPKLVAAHTRTWLLALEGTNVSHPLAPSPLRSWPTPWVKEAKLPFPYRRPLRPRMKNLSVLGLHSLAGRPFVRRHRRQPWTLVTPFGLETRIGTHRQYPCKGPARG